MKRLLIILSCFITWQTVLAQTVDFKITSSTCVNTPIIFTDITDDNTSYWVWDFGDGFIEKDVKTAQHTYNVAGEYTVKLTVTVLGMEYFTEKKVTVHNYPFCDFEIDTVFYSSFTRVFKDKSESEHKIAKFIWEFGDGEKTSIENITTAQHQYKKEGEFTITHRVIDDGGCDDQVSKKVVIKDLFDVPNVFSPNGDGINDLFIVKSNGVVEFDIEIVSRWGNLVFKREGVKRIVWDGTMPDGSKLQTGTYFYIIKATNSDKEYTPERGHITVFCEN